MHYSRKAKAQREFGGETYNFVEVKAFQYLGLQQTETMKKYKQEKRAKKKIKLSTPTKNFQETRI